jgi:predicted 2-oxoglutarate/Fe(II)-dependent dioxygenase YbiX
MLLRVREVLAAGDVHAAREILAGAAWGDGKVTAGVQSAPARNNQQLPHEYDGGELMIEDTFGAQRVKLAAGDMVLYPGTSVHRVEPVTRGWRIASFFWIESMVRSDAQRRLLFEMDTHLMRLRGAHGETDPAVIGLTGTYHNLLRMWADA